MNRVRKHQKNSLRIKPTDALNSNFIDITTLMFRATFLSIIGISQAYISFGKSYADVMNVYYQEQDGTSDIQFNIPVRTSAPFVEICDLQESVSIPPDAATKPRPLPSTPFVTFSSLSQYPLMLQLSPDLSLPHYFQCIIHYNLIKRNC